MSDDFSELERSLRHLRPARVPSRLTQSISGALAQREVVTVGAAASRRPARYATATSWTSWKWANWGVAAALAIAAVVGTRHAPVDQGSAGAAGLASGPTREAETALLAGTDTGARSTAADLTARGFQPVDALRLLVETTDEGVVTLADGTPVRRLRERYVDSVTWRQPETNASLVVSLPREDIRFQRLALY